METVHKLEWEEKLWINDKGGGWGSPHIEIMQYTGLKDKNGKEIYAKDCLGGVFECLYIDWCDKQGGWELFTGGNECMACMGEIHWWEVVENKDLEVIGNIYENPELIK